MKQATCAQKMECLLLSNLPLLLSKAHQPVTSGTAPWTSIWNQPYKNVYGYIKIYKFIRIYTATFWWILQHFISSKTVVKKCTMTALLNKAKRKIGPFLPSCTKECWWVAFFDISKPTRWWNRFTFPYMRIGSALFVESSISSFQKVDLT